MPKPKKLTDEQYQESLAVAAERQGWPEHAKLYRLHNKNEVVGDFLEWLDRQGYAIYVPQYRGGRTMTRSHQSTQSWLAHYFGINEGALDREKKQMLAQVREAQRQVIEEKASA